MATQALLHEILLALLGHTGQCIQARIAPVAATRSAAGASAAPDDQQQPQWEVTGLELAADVPWVTPAERAAINALLEAGFAYVRIMHFAQSIDGGATAQNPAAAPTVGSTAGGSVAAAASAASIAAAALHTKLASSAAEQRALEAQQARHVYAAAGALLSPPRAARPSRPHHDEADEPNDGATSVPRALFDSSTALVPARPLHPLVDAPAERSQPKAVGLYLRALGLGLEEVLSGYRSLVLKVEQEILAEWAQDPASAPRGHEGTGGPRDQHQPQPQQQQQPRRIEFGLARLSLMLRQYLVILPALQSMLAAIVAPPAPAPAPAAAATGSSPDTDPAAPPAPAAPSSQPHRTHSIHGLRLLSYLAEQASSGVPLLRQVFQGLLRHLDRVLVHQVTNWVFYGAVLDPFGEFFVREAPELASSSSASGAGAGGGTGAAGAGAGGAAAQRMLRSFSARGFGTPLGGGGSLAGGSSAGGGVVSQLDWDSSYTLAAAQLPHAYLPLMGGMATAHRVLFLGKAVLVLQQGEAEREAREARAKARARDARRAHAPFSPFGAGVGVGAGVGGERSSSHARTASAAFGSGSGWPGSGSGGKTPGSRSYAGSAAPTPRFVSPTKDSVSAAAGAGFFRPGSAAPAASAAAAVSPPVPSVPLLVECQPLLTQFHLLRSQSECLLSGDSLPRLESLLHRLSTVVSRRMYSLLMGDCALQGHLAHLKSFALLSSGEFATAFVERAGGVAVGAGAGAGAGGGGGGCGVLSRPAGPRSERELNAPNGPLKSALAYAGLRMDLDDDDDAAEEEEGQGFSAWGPAHAVSVAVANYPAKNLVLHLDAPPAAPASLANTGPSSSAAAAARASASASLNPWVCLRLSYALRPPLDLVVTPQSMRGYNKLFRVFLHAKRVHLSLQQLWMPLMSTRAGHLPGARGLRGNMGAMLLRQSMSHVLSTLRGYFHLDVVESCWAELLRRLAEAREFDAVRAAHDRYLAEITGHCFLKDRIVSSALTDVLDTCLLFCRSYPPPAAALERLSSDYARQLCFLYSLLSRKTDFTGGRASLLHALVSRLDFNGHITRLSANLGLNRNSKAVVPAASHGRGTVPSVTGIATSLHSGSSSTGAGGGAAAYGSSSRPSERSSSSTTRSRDSASSAPSNASSSSFGFTPAHLTASSSSSAQAASHQAHLFSTGSTRPPAHVPSPREY